MLRAEEIETLMREELDQVEIVEHFELAVRQRGLRPISPHLFVRLSTSREALSRSTHDRHARASGRGEGRPARRKAGLRQHDAVGMGIAPSLRGKW